MQFLFWGTHVFPFMGGLELVWMNEAPSLIASRSQLQSVVRSVLARHSCTGCGEALSNVDYVVGETVYEQSSAERSACRIFEGEMFMRLSRFFRDVDVVQWPMSRGSPMLEKLVPPGDVHGVAESILSMMSSFGGSYEQSFRLGVLEFVALKVGRWGSGLPCPEVKVALVV